MQAARKRKFELKYIRYSLRERIKIDKSISTSLNESLQKEKKN